MPHYSLWALGLMLLATAPSFGQHTLAKHDFNPGSEPKSSWPGGGVDWTPAGPPSLAHHAHTGVRSFDLLAGSAYFLTDGLEGAGGLYRANGTALVGAELVHAPEQLAPDGAFADLAVAGDRVYLVLLAPGGSLQLWSSKGSAGSLALELSLPLGGPSAALEELVPVGARLFGRYVTSAAGSEVFVADPASPGAAALLDLMPGPGASCERLLTEVPGAGLAFGFGGDLATGGAEPWVTDGTPGGTLVLGDLEPGAGGSWPGRAVPFGSLVLFTATTSALGQELYVTDGTPAGTQLLGDLEPGPGSSSPDLHVEGIRAGYLYFSASRTATGRELYRTDGTPGGTQLVHDANPGPASSDPEPLGLAGSQLLFGADLGGGAGHELSMLFNQTLQPVADLVPGPGDSSPSAGATLGLSQVFAARAPGGSPGVWVSDGSAAGTMLLHAVTYTGAGQGPPTGFVKAPLGGVLFSSSDAQVGAELFTTSGTPGSTFVLADVNPGATPNSSNPRALGVLAGGTLVLSTDQPQELLALQPGGQLVGAVGDTFGFTKLGPERLWLGGEETIVFSTGSGWGDSLPGLVRTDGTAAGTAPLFEEPVGTTWWSERLLGDLGTGLLFLADDGAHGLELWFGDGSLAGTQLVVETVPGVGSTHDDETPSVVLEGVAYFFVGSYGSYEVWRSDGTAAGTYPLPGSATDFTTLGPFVVSGDRAFASLRTPSLGEELWVVEPALDQLRLVSDLVPGPLGSEPQLLTDLGGTLLFFVEAGAPAVSGLYRSDATAAGTVLVDPDVTWTLKGTEAEVVGGRLYFQAWSAGQGTELWSSDGQAVAQVVDLRPGYHGSDPSSLTACGEHLYFLAELPASGREVHVTDGTAAGTALAFEVAPGDAGIDGSGSFSPTSLTLAGGRLYLVARDTFGETELYSTPVPFAHVLDLGSSGSGARLSATPPKLGGTTNVSVEAAPAGALGVLAMSAPVAAPGIGFVAPGNALWIDPTDFTLLGVGTTPSWSVTQAIPNQPALFGVQVNVQAWFLPPGLLPAATSNGLRLVLGS